MLKLSVGFLSSLEAKSPQTRFIFQINWTHSSENWTITWPLLSIRDVSNVISYFNPSYDGQCGWAFDIALIKT